MSNYIRAPFRAVTLDPELRIFRQVDRFGIEDRLRLIQDFFSQRGSVGSIADLGGNCGFFSLSLLDAGAANSALVYDLGENFLEAGRRFSTTLGLDKKVSFINQEITLDFVKNSLPRVDLILCLNLIHHAGYYFDNEDVGNEGWAAYALNWLNACGLKSDILVLGVGFKESLPISWIKPTRLEKFDSRPLALAQIIEQSEWKIDYESNISDLSKYGIANAPGRRMSPRTQGSVFTILDFCTNFLYKIRYKLEGILGFRFPNKRERGDRKSKYHIYILTKK